MKAEDDRPVWSISCFVVPSEHRRQGVAIALLRGALNYARKNGAKIVEAYPVDHDADPSAESLWFGTKTVYDDAGFVEVARRKGGAADRSRGFPLNHTGTLRSSAHRRLP